MDAWGAYLLYNALRLHFTSSYDYHKYLGKVPRLSTKDSHDRFLRNKQRYLFHSLSRHEDPEGLCLANMLKNPKIYVAELIQPQANSVWEAWQRRNQSITYTFEKEMETNRNWSRLYEVTSSGMPYLLDRYIAGEISAETIAIIDRFGNILEKMESIDHPLVKQHLDTLKQYRPFVKFDKTRCKKVLMDLADL